MSISKNQTVNETNDVKLSCRATGTPAPNVTWSKAGNENNILSSNSFFTMTNISREQDGLYWCTADNGLSKAVASTRITVQCRHHIRNHMQRGKQKKKVLVKKCALTVKTLTLIGL